MKIIRRVAGISLCLAVLAGCAATENSARRTGPRSEARSASAIEEHDRPIVLPASSNQRLPQGPGDGTERGVLIAAAMVAANDGVIVSGTVESIRIEKGEFDLDYPVVQLRVDQTYAGNPTETVTIRTADPIFEVEVGGAYLAFLTRNTPDAPYTPVDTYLFDRSGTSWRARQPPKADGQRPDQPLVLAEEGVSRLIDEGKAYLDQRLAAGRAVMRTEAGENPGEVVVSGFADGESIELRVCAVRDGFNPKTDAALRCGSDGAESLVPDGSSFTVTYWPPKQLDLGDGTQVSCDKARCALVAYDAGWPDKVFAIFDGSQV